MQSNLKNLVLGRLPEPKNPDQSWQLGIEALERKDYATAARMFTRSTEDGEWYVHFMLGYLNLGPSPEIEPDVDAAIRHFEIAAKSEHVIPSLSLAVLLIETDKEIERKRAFSILVENAERGDVLSKIYLGYLLNEGRATERDEQRALTIWREAADQKWAWAMRLLAHHAKQNGKFLEFIKWKWLGAKTVFALAKVDKDDTRLINAF
jgi:TPR repeat protein